MFQPSFKGILCILPKLQKLYNLFTIKFHQITPLYLTVFGFYSTFQIFLGIGLLIKLIMNLILCTLVNAESVLSNAQDFIRQEQN